MNNADIDVSQLPNAAWGPRAPIWWGTTVMVIIESMVFALCIATYFYLAARAPAWPPAGTPDPAVRAATWNLLLMLASCVPMAWIDVHARNGNTRTLRLLMVFITIAMIPILLLRAVEFRALQTTWRASAYGSVVWTILGLHSAHLLASFLEDATLTYYAFKRPLDAQHRTDLAVNSFYWFFVTGSWVILYGVVYWSPRLL
jgi:heme/copper-type cytochrome/quinol oxidase subunit 3